MCCERWGQVALITLDPIRHNVIEIDGAIKKMKMELLQIEVEYIEIDIASDTLLTTFSQVSSSLDRAVPRTALLDCQEATHRAELVHRSQVCQFSRPAQP